MYDHETRGVTFRSILLLLLLSHFSIFKLAGEEEGAEDDRYQRVLVKLVKTHGVSWAILLKKEKKKGERKKQV